MTAVSSSCSIDRGVSIRYWTVPPAVVIRLRTPIINLKVTGSIFVLMVVWFLVTNVTRDIEHEDENSNPRAVIDE